jgi:IS5 family transposase
VLEDLLHGEETRVWGDSAYTGQKQVLHEHAPNAKDFTQQKGSRYRTLSDDEHSRNRNKSRVRSKVEHIFHVMKRQFGFTKVRYRGLDKNAHLLFVNCTLINLVMAKKRLLRISQVTCA